ncbi:MAG: hypothetical protein ACI8Y7_000585 [Candidatus Woesearchaeota archaeon]|jgi:hypothetical protein
MEEIIMKSKQIMAVGIGALALTGLVAAGSSQVFADDDVQEQVEQMEETKFEYSFSDSDYLSRTAALEDQIDALYEENEDAYDEIDAEYDALLEMSWSDDLSFNQLDDVWDKMDVLDDRYELLNEQFGISQLEDQLDEIEGEFDDAFESALYDELEEVMDYFVGGFFDAELSDSVIEGFESGLGDYADFDDEYELTDDVDALVYELIELELDKSATQEQIMQVISQIEALK